MEMLELMEIWGYYLRSSKSIYCSATCSWTHHTSAMLVIVCPDLLCWSLQRVQLHGCHLLLQVLASSGTSSLWSVSLCRWISCSLSHAIQCHKSCPTFESISFISVSGSAVQDAGFSHCLKLALTAWCHLMFDQFGLTGCLSVWQWS